MKKSILIAILVIVTGVLFYACQDNMVSDSNAKADDGKNARVLACTYVTLSGALTTQTLVNTNTYLLSGVVRVPSGVTLTINAGTKIMGIKSTTAPAWLIVEPGGTINSNGTSTSPVVFTSDQTAGSRAPGDWGGIMVMGSAPNNQSNALGVIVSGTTYTAGGTSSGTSSGTIQYTQIHFAGFGGGTGSNERSEGSLVLNSVDSGTNINHIQISKSKFDGVSVWGGRVNLNYLFLYDVQRTGFNYSFGYVGRNQFVSEIKRNGAPVADAFGIKITNDLASATSATTPRTYPVISNMTLFGPAYCGGTPDIDYKDGINFQNNGSAKVYNSVISSYPRYGLNLEGNLVVSNTAAGTYELQFAYNAFHNSGTSQYFDNASPNWSSAGGCGSGLTPSMTQWITGAGTATCREAGNQFTVATLGYNSSFCADYCNAFTPNFILGATTLSASNFGWDTGNLFAHPTYRGAFDTSTSWVTNNWANLCPQTTDYCL